MEDNDMSDYTNFFLAKKYLFAKKKDRFLSVTIRFAWIGIIIGVATLIIVTSVMNGFQCEIVEKLSNINGHVIIRSNKGINSGRMYDILNFLSVKSEVSNTNYILKQNALFSHNNEFDGIVAISSHNDLGYKLVHGAKNPESVGIGMFFSKKYGVKIGDKITIISRRTFDTGIGEMPLSKTFTVGYIFDAGIYQYDTHVVVVPFNIAKKLFCVEGITDIQVWVKDPLSIGSLKDDISNFLINDEILSDWMDNNAGLLHAVRVEKNVMFVILTLIILVAGFNIITSMVMLVKDKVKDIAILKTIGFSDFSIMKIFFLCGGIIGIGSTFIGSVLGIAFSYYINDIKKLLERLLELDLFPAEIYYLLELPSKLEIGEVLLIIVVTLLISFLSAVFPAMKAARMKPLDILRYE